VVAADQHERVPVGDELRELAEHEVVALGDGAHLVLGVITGATEPVQVLLVVERCLELGAFARRDRHAHEVDQVASDDQRPGSLWLAVQPVVLEHRGELAVDPQHLSQTRHRPGTGVLHEIRPEVNIGKQ
jgi:hypothetical protein